MNKNTHQGHRNRLRKAMKGANFNNFHKHQILEFVLFHCIIKKDTNVIAHDLLNKFKTIDNILKANKEELKKINGLGDYSATFLNFLGDVIEIYINRKQTNDKQFLINKYKSYIISQINEEKEALFYIVSIDSKSDILNLKKIYRKLKYIDIYHEIVKNCVYLKVNSIILFLNHLMGTNEPTIKEKELAIKLKRDLKAIDIELLDFIIVSSNEIATSISYYCSEFND